MAAPAPAPRRTRITPGRITATFALLLAAAVAACTSTPVLEDHLAGWQGERDAQKHAFAHQSFALNRELNAQASTPAPAEALQWPRHAAPMLETATQARAVHQAEGRALVLERLLTHMRGDPSVAETEAWFAGETGAIEAAADAAGTETAAVAATFAEPLALNEGTLRRVSATAAREGRIRGEAFQLTGLRRSAGNYFRRLGYDKSALAFAADEAGGPAPEQRLMSSVDNRLGWAALREAILQPRTCERTEATVTCAPDPAGGAPLPDGPAQDVAPPARERTILPGESIRWSEPKVRAPDLLDRRPGW